jgi:hypothetical protein
MISITLSSVTSCSCVGKVRSAVWLSIIQLHFVCYIQGDVSAQKCITFICRLMCTVSKWFYIWTSDKEYEMFLLHCLCIALMWHLSCTTKILIKACFYVESIHQSTFNNTASLFCYSCQNRCYDGSSTVAMYESRWITLVVFVCARNHHHHITGGVSMMYLVALVHFKIKRKYTYYST